MIGAELARLRKESGMSQAQLADQLGVSRETIRDIEIGAQSGRSLVERIAEILGVDPYALDPEYTPGAGKKFTLDPRMPP